MRKNIGWVRKTCGVLLSLLTAWMIFSPTSQALRELPEIYRLNVGDSYAFKVGTAVLSSTDERLNLSNNTLTVKEKGEADIAINLFGLFPIGRMRVQAGDERRLMPGGAAVGVALATRGVLVIGVSDVSGKSPAQGAGLRAGDIIQSVNGQAVNSSQHLVELVSASKGVPLSLTFERNGSKITYHKTLPFAKVDGVVGDIIIRQTGRIYDDWNEYGHELNINDLVTHQYK